MKRYMKDLVIIEVCQKINFYGDVPSLPNSITFLLFILIVGQLMITSWLK